MPALSSRVVQRAWLAVVLLVPLAFVPIDAEASKPNKPTTSTPKPTTSTPKPKGQGTSGPKSTPGTRSSPGGPVRPPAGRNAPMASKPGIGHSPGAPGAAARAQALGRSALAGKPAATATGKPITVPGGRNQPGTPGTRPSTPGTRPGSSSPGTAAQPGGRNAASAGGKPRLDLGPKAYGQGSTPNLGSGKERHLGHECCHVVQQRPGGAGASAGPPRALQTPPAPAGAKPAASTSFKRVDGGA